MLRRFRYKGMAPWFKPLVFAQPKDERSLSWVVGLLVIGAGLAAILSDWRQRDVIPKKHSLLIEVVTHSVRHNPTVKTIKRTKLPPQQKKQKKRIFKALGSQKTSVRKHKRRRPPISAKPDANRKVFGVNKAGVTKGKSQMAVRVGNTLMKPPDKVYKPQHKKLIALSGEKDRVFNAGEVERPPKFIFRAVPKYPEEAEEDEVEGVVTVWLVIDQHGRPVKVERVLGPRQDLEHAAKQAAMHSRFSPATYKSKPVRCRVKIPYRFRLE